MAKKTNNDSPNTLESLETSNAGSPAADVVPAPAAVEDSADAVGANTEGADSNLAVEPAAAVAADAAVVDAGKAARGEEIEPPDWQKPDYSGPLNIEQAEWRNTRLQRK